MATTISPANAQKVWVFAANPDGTLSPATIGGGGGSGTVTSIATTSPITGGPITTTGTIGCATCTTNAAALTANALVIGGGGQATSALGSLGTTTTVLHGNAGGAPTFGAVNLAADVSGQLPISAVGSSGLSSSSPITISAAGAIACATCATSAASLTSNALVLGAGSQGTQTLPGFTTNGVAVLTLGAVGTGSGGITFVGTTSGSVPCVVSASTSTLTCTGNLAATSTINAGSVFQVGGRVIFQSTAPTITTGTGATIANSNGTSVFTINVGTGGLTSIVIGLPSSGVTNGWHCTVNNRTSMSSTVFVTKQTNSALSNNSCTIGNFTAAGVSGAWNNSDLLSVNCLPD